MKLKPGVYLNKKIKMLIIEGVHTCKIVIPAAVNESSSSFLEEFKGPSTLAGRTRTKVG